SVLHRTAMRLIQALEKVQPASVRDFFNLAARHMRWELLNLARNHPADGPLLPLNGESTEESRTEGPADSSDGPDRLAIWTQFHRKAGARPEAEREVFESLWYHGRTQAETAELLDLHPKEVSRRWGRARLLLIEWVPEIEYLL